MNCPYCNREYHKEYGHDVWTDAESGETLTIIDFSDSDRSIGLHICKGCFKPVGIDYVDNDLTLAFSPESINPPIEQISTDGQTALGSDGTTYWRKHRDSSQGGPYWVPMEMK